MTTTLPGGIPSSRRQLTCRPPTHKTLVKQNKCAFLTTQTPIPVPMSHAIPILDHWIAMWMDEMEPCIGILVDAGF